MSISIRLCYGQLSCSDLTLSGHFPAIKAIPTTYAGQWRGYLIHQVCSGHSDDTLAVNFGGLWGESSSIWTPLDISTMTCGVCGASELPNLILTVRKTTWNVKTPARTPAKCYLLHKSTVKVDLDTRIFGLLQKTLRRNDHPDNYIGDPCYVSGQLHALLQLQCRL